MKIIRKAPLMLWMNFLPMEEVRKFAIILFVLFQFNYAKIISFLQVS